MIREATNTESALDFIHKLAVAQKEIGETQYWLELLCRTHYLTTTEFDSMNSDAEEIMKMLRSAILTKKKNLAVKVVSITITIAIMLNIMGCGHS